MPLKLLCKQDDRNEEQLTAPIDYHPRAQAFHPHILKNNRSPRMMSIYLILLYYIWCMNVCLSESLPFEIAKKLSDAMWLVVVIHICIFGSSPCQLNIKKLTYRFESVLETASCATEVNRSQSIPSASTEMYRRETSVVNAFDAFLHH